MLKSIKTREHGEVFFVQQEAIVTDPTKVSYEMYAENNFRFGTIVVDETKPLPTASDIDNAIDNIFGVLPF